MKKNENQLKDVFVPAKGNDVMSSEKETKIGIAFVNKDGTISVILDAVPFNGRLEIRDRVTKREV